MGNTHWVCALLLIVALDPIHAHAVLGPREASKGTHAEEIDSLADRLDRLLVVLNLKAAEVWYGRTEERQKRIRHATASVLSLPPSCVQPGSSKGRGTAGIGQRKGERPDELRQQTFCHD